MEINSTALDRHITGNDGDDITGGPECPECGAIGSINDSPYLVGKAEGYGFCIECGEDLIPMQRASEHRNTDI